MEKCCKYIDRIYFECEVIHQKSCKYVNDKWNVYDKNDVYTYPCQSEKETEYWVIADEVIDTPFICIYNFELRRWIPDKNVLYYRKIELPKSPGISIHSIGNLPTIA